MGSSFAIVLVTLLWYPGDIDKTADARPIPNMAQCIKLRDSYLHLIDGMNAAQDMPAFIINASAVCLRLYNGERDQA